MHPPSTRSVTYEELVKVRDGSYRATNCSCGWSGRATVCSECGLPTKPIVQANAPVDYLAYVRGSDSQARRSDGDGQASRPSVWSVLERVSIWTVLVAVLLVLFVYTGIADSLKDPDELDYPPSTGFKLAAVVLITYLTVKGARFWARIVEESASSQDSGPSRTRRISSATRREVWARDGGHCRSCGSTVDLELDHIIPFSRGGSNTAQNIELLCRPCNRGKAARIQ